MRKLYPLACLTLLGAAGASAQQAPVADPAPAPAATTVPASVTPGSADAAPSAPLALGAEPAKSPDAKGQQGVVPSVVIGGSRASDIDLRRNATAAKLVFGREELDRNGDSSIGEILKRLPGVTMGGRPGRGGEIRMRGLGSGYTQMLVNGERAPAGFALDSLTPDQVERIEVIRGPVAEHSTQAIAGTINIVLREGYQQKDVQLKLTDSIEQQRHSANVSLTVPGKAGALTYTLSGSIVAGRGHDQSRTALQDETVGGDVVRVQRVDDSSERRNRAMHLTPRLNYRFDNGDTLTFQPFIVANRSEGRFDSALVQSTGKDAAEYVRADGTSSSAVTFLRGFGNWVHRMEGGAKLDIKYGMGRGHTSTDTDRLQLNAQGDKLRLQDSDATRDHGLMSGGKYTTPLGQGHLLAAGWDLEAQHREQDHVSLANGVPQALASGASLVADTRRFAAFAQDEWDITPQWATYFGLRWEGVRTVSSRGGAEVVNISRVWSPVLHGVWRIPGYEKDQLRASYTHSYRAPQVADLIAIPVLSHPNSASRPDRVGNAQLKPELARGIDLAYEHYLGRTGILSASGFVREIDELMRRTTTQRTTEQGLRYVSMPINIGHASTRGIELEAKFQLAELQPDAPNVDVRANYSRFWSNVDDVPGPNNRLDQQARQSANLGVDYRLKALPLTLGASFNWTPPGQVRTSTEELVESGAKRQLDLYGLWKFNPLTQLRIAANNLGHRDYESARVYSADGLAQAAATSARTYATWSIKLEMKI